jgi:hypothetical protein
MFDPALPDCRESDWEKVPAHLRKGLRAYLVERRRPGQFLSALLRNDLADTVLRADDDSVAALRDLVLFLHNCAPGPSHGSEAVFEAWLAGAGAAR